MLDRLAAITESTQGEHFEMPSTATSEPTLFAELDRPAIVRAYIDGPWRTVRVLRYFREGKVSVALFSPKGGWRKLSKPILQSETRHIKIGAAP